MRLVFVRQARRAKSTVTAPRDRPVSTANVRRLLVCVTYVVVRPAVWLVRHATTQITRKALVPGRPSAKLTLSARLLLVRRVVPFVRRHLKSVSTAFARGRHLPSLVSVMAGLESATKRHFATGIVIVHKERPASPRHWVGCVPKRRSLFTAVPKRVVLLASVVSTRTTRLVRVRWCVHRHVIVPQDSIASAPSALLAPSLCIVVTTHSNVPQVRPAATSKTRRVPARTRPEHVSLCVIVYRAKVASMALARPSPIRRTVATIQAASRVLLV
jgi:hypothetical protein